jgi:Protein of unknown function (DUF3617)
MKPLFSILMLTAAASQAADMTPLGVKPGLWETTTVTDRGGMMPTLSPETLAKMPPEARARIEGMSKPITDVRKSCRTDKDLRPFTDDSNKSCKYTVLTSTSSKQEIRMDCTMQGNTTTGTTTIEAKNSEHVAGTVIMKMNVSGRNADMKITIDSKWMGSSCGDVKPDIK